MEHNETCKDLEMENRTNGIHHYQITKPLTDCECGCHSSGHFLYYETEFTELVKLQKKLNDLLQAPDFNQTTKPREFILLSETYGEMRDKLLQESRIPRSDYEKRVWRALHPEEASNGEIA